MREIGEARNQEPLDAFADYLLTIGMKTEIRTGGNNIKSIWLIDESRLPEARSLFSEFLAAPDDPKFAKASHSAGKIRKAEVKLERDYAKRVKDAGQIYNSGQFLRRTPVVNLLIGLSIAVTLMTNFGKRTMFVINYINLTTPRYDPNDGWVIDSLSGALGYEPWRLIAPLFLHMSFLHILFNMSWLSQLGGMVEREKKSWFLLFLVLTTHIVASFTEYFWNIYGLQRNVILFGGFSGAVYGLIGFVWMYSEFNRFSEIRLSSQNLQLALFWMVLCFTGYLGPIANGAHFGGLVAGMIIGMISGRRDAQRQW